MRISDWSSDVCSSDLLALRRDNSGFATMAHYWAAVSVRKWRPRAVMRKTVRRLAIGVTSERWLFSHCLTSSNRSLSEAAVMLKKSEEHTSELQSLMRISYAVFCLKKKKTKNKK